MKKELTLIFFLLICLFLTGQQPSQELGPMPDVVFETSGMVFYDGKLITHNDSGNTAQLFEIDTVSLEVTRTITVTNIENKDWEDMAQDELYLYIGDFGNNQGTRKDLAIYRILKTDYNVSDNVLAETINFTYEDQVDFANNGNSDWDAEALFVINDQLIILTKQWQSEGTTAYSLPKSPGNHKAIQLDSYDTKGFVTGATYNPLTENLYIIGYNKLLYPFLFAVSGADENIIFGGNVSRTDFEIGPTQVESIANVNENTYLFSSEVFTRENPPINLPSLLYSFTIGEATEQEDEVEEEEQEQEGVVEQEEEQEQEGVVEQEEEQEQVGGVEQEEEQEQDDSMEEVDEEESNEEQESSNPEMVPDIEEFNGQQLVLYRPFGSDMLEYRLNVEGTVFGIGVFDTSGRRIVNLPYNTINENTLNVSTLGGSIYYLSVYTTNGVVTKPFVGR